MTQAIFYLKENWSVQRNIPLGNNIKLGVIKQSFNINNKAD
jgi:hypothetical protein